jgi:hypothetical protein
MEEPNLKAAKNEFVRALCSPKQQERAEAADLLRIHLVSGVKQEKHLAKEIVGVVLTSKNEGGIKSIVDLADDILGEQIVEFGYFHEIRSANSLSGPAISLEE